MAKSKNHLFLSYAYADKKWADWIVTGMAEHSIPVWYDAQHVFPGDNRDLQVGRALENSQGMIVLLSPQSTKSREVRSQIDYALGSTRYANCLVIVELKPSPEAPWVLRQMPWIKATDPEKTVEHLAKVLWQQFDKSPLWSKAVA